MCVDIEENISHQQEEQESKDDESYKECSHCYSTNVKACLIALMDEEG